MHEELVALRDIADRGGSIPPKVLEHLAFALGDEEDQEQAPAAAALEGWAQIAQSIYRHYFCSSGGHRNAMTDDAQAALWAAIAQVRACVDNMESEALFMMKCDYEWHEVEIRLQGAHHYVGLLLEDCRRGVEEPVEPPKRMSVRKAFEETRRKLPKKLGRKAS